MQGAAMVRSQIGWNIPVSALEQLSFHTANEFFLHWYQNKTKSTFQWEYLGMKAMVVFDKWKKQKAH